MERYKIPCTAEQTKKALELGAPIGYKNTLDNKERGKFENPTAEEMIGWLIDKGIHVEIEYCLLHEDYDICILDEDKHKTMYNDVFGLPTYSSREGATLAAIDAALDYLTKNK